MQYTLLAYLRDRLLFILLSIALMAVLSAMLAVIQVPNDGIVFADILVLLFAGTYLVYDHVRQKQFWKDIEEAARTLDSVEYFGDLIERPGFLTGRISYESARGISDRAAEEIAELKADIRDDREYIELWVHEAKTPIAAAKLILDKMHGPDVARLKRELERNENLVEQALFSARSKTLSNDYLIREVPLSEMIRTACKQNMHYLTSLGISVDIDIDPQLKVFADKTWLAFIISQLITNSAKYDSTRILFTANVPEKESASACTLLKVQDNGCGIPEHDVPRVFDRGFTGDIGRSHGSATGMGLYLAARMCAQMGLGIMLASELGTGTRVEISFPHDRRRAKLART